MIFVTVGNGKFEELVQKVDELVAGGKIRDKVIIQLGHGKYKPRQCEWFTFKSPLTPYYRKASLVISHGGPGVVFEVLTLKKKLIAIPNRDRTDPRHQVEYLRAMAKETSALRYCDKVELLESCLNQAKKHRFGQYKSPLCTIPEKIITFLK
ncbi:hypothetical protein HYU22_00395 [Candidatus Woesearchaeota archaeon]|nr:hypothetical protein [Candidatus Woesearchaeota archaeon]